MPERLTILGASVRAAVQSAQRAGFAPTAIDLFADRDLAALCPTTRIKDYPADFVSALAETPPSPWMYTGGLENYPQLIEQLAAVRPLLGNRGYGLVQVRDPSQLAAAAENAGCRFPIWLRVTTGEAPRTHRDGGWLLKPRNSSGGQLVRWATSSNVTAASATTYMQQHIAGQCASAVYLGAGGRAVLLGATRQLIGSDFGLARAFLYVGSIGPLDLGPPEMEELTQLGNVLAKTFGLIGLFNVDFIRNSSGLWVLEVNPRYSASVEILERLTSASFVAFHVTACQEQTLPQAVAAPKCFAGKAVVYAERPCRVADAFANLEASWEVAAGWPAIADLPRIGQAFRAGEPIATVFAAGSSVTEVEEELTKRAAKVQAIMASTEY